MKQMIQQPSLITHHQHSNTYPAYQQLLVWIHPTTPSFIAEHSIMWHGISLCLVWMSQ